MATLTPAHHNLKVEILLRSILSSICRKTPSMEVIWSERNAMFMVRVGAADQGRIIGKKGKTFWSVATMLWWAGMSQGSGPATFKILDPIGPKAPEIRQPFLLNPKWNRARISDLLNSIANTILKTQGNWSMIDMGPGEAKVEFRVEKYLSTAMSDPSFEEALKTVIHAAGMSDGAVIETEVLWT